MKRRKHVVFLGLNGSGKTTILMQLKYKCYLTSVPTVGFNHEKVMSANKHYLILVNRNYYQVFAGKISKF